VSRVSTLVVKKSSNLYCFQQNNIGTVSSGRFDMFSINHTSVMIYNITTYILVVLHIDKISNKILSTHNY